MTKYKLEYIWLDGYTPTPNLRGKTQIKEFDAFPTLEQLPLWGFDGSSTMQAEGRSSDCVLKPVALYPDPARTNGALVMCEVMMPDGVTPHDSNKRATILDDADTWFGFEQEYFFYKDGRPLGFPSAGYPAPQGPYYTGVGFTNVGDVARKIVEEHLDLCLAAGINHEGINAEVAKGQWEFQIFGKGSKKAADEIWMARYLLLRLTEKYGIDIEFHCKPLGDTDWNGSGMHANFSTKFMREIGGKEYFEALMKAFEKNRADHIAVYGPDNHMRLTGKHETASIELVQLRRGRPRRIDPRAAQLRQERVQGLSRRPPPELAGRPIPDRLADPEDDRGSPDRGEEGCGVSFRSLKTFIAARTSRFGPFCFCGCLMDEWRPSPLPCGERSDCVSNPGEGECHREFCNPSPQPSPFGRGSAQCVAAWMLVEKKQAGGKSPLSAPALAQAKGVSRGSSCAKNITHTRVADACPLALCGPKCGRAANAVMLLARQLDRDKARFA